MNVLRIIGSLGFVALLFTSCKDKKAETQEECDGVLRVTVQPTFGGDFLQLDSTYTTVEGYDVQFTDIKFFVEDIRGDAQILDAAFFDYRETGTLLFQEIGEPTQVTTLMANLGVGAVNHDDPSAFPVESVLNINNSGGMHWGWSPGYIFVKVEARIDTIADAIPLFDQSVVFHIGKDINLQTLSFPSFSWIEYGNNSYLASLKLDMSRFLQNSGQNIDLRTENSSHTSGGQEVLSLKVMENFKAAISEF
ncbi:MAG: hypothetical protein ACI837_001607 [Crocinitomicaceae bacterium]|jgi:hypothetical protein